jgi:hypothetical protein
MSVAYAFSPEPPLALAADLGELEARLYEYWLDIHPGGDLLPGRQHFDPAELGSRYPALLQHLWLVDVEREPLRFRLRLVGSAVYMTSPFARAGHCIDEFIDPASRAETLQSSFTRLVETREPGFRRGRPRLPSVRNARELSRLSLPLAADGRTVDMILNITTYVGAQPDGPAYGRLM